VGQLSFFSADLLPPVVDDLGGVLAAGGQISANASGARLSMVIGDRVRAVALAEECSARGVDAEVVDAADSGRQLVRTVRCAQLAGLAANWTRGSAKVVPDGLVISPGFLRIWALAAGSSDESGYLLGIDAHAPDSVEALIAACSRAGLAGSYIGSRGGGPGIRIVGHRRLARLVDTVGTLPEGLPQQAYPVDVTAGTMVR
jgi:hypothetical protein